MEKYLNEFIEKLKEENLVPDNTTVIALTANAVVGAKERYLEDGCPGIHL